MPDCCLDPSCQRKLAFLHQDVYLGAVYLGIWTAPRIKSRTTVRSQVSSKGSVGDSSWWRSENTQGQVLTHRKSSKIMRSNLFQQGGNLSSKYTHPSPHMGGGVHAVTSHKGKDTVYFFHGVWNIEAGDSPAGNWRRCSEKGTHVPKTGWWMGRWGTGMVVCAWAMSTWWACHRVLHLYQFSLDTQGLPSGVA